MGIEKSGVPETEEKQYITLTAEFEDFDDTEVKRTYRFSRPGKMKMSRCQREMVKAADKALATLVLDCVHPDEREALRADIDLYPGLPNTFGGEILKRAGFDSLGK